MREGGDDTRLGGSPMMRPLRRALLAVLGICVFAAIGFSGLLYHQLTHPRTGPATYVALGSSFAAGPGIALREAGSPLVCGRSASNYAHHVARALRLDLLDRSCSGATTRHVLQGGQYFQPPQIAPIDARTRLVTVTVGGNDFNYAGTMMTQRCVEPTLTMRLFRTCRPWSASRVRDGVRQAEANLRRIA